MKPAPFACLALAATLSVSLPSVPVLAAAAAAQESPAAAAAAPDVSTPKATVESLFAAFARGDLKAMVPCVLGASVTPDLDALQKEFAAGPPPGSGTVSDVKVYKSDAGDEAMASFLLSWRPEGGGPESEAKRREVLTLRRDGDAWRIVPPDPEAMERGAEDLRGLSLGETIALTARYPQAILAGRRAARSTVALSNLKQIGVATLMYSQDWDEVLPPDPAKAPKALEPYLRDRAVFTSPLDAKGAASFKFNPQLARRKLEDIEDPTNMVLFFEGEYKKLNFRYDGKAAVCFADGSARLVTPEAAKSLRWTP